MFTLLSNLHAIVAFGWLPVRNIGENPINMSTIQYVPSVLLNIEYTFGKSAHSKPRACVYTLVHVCLRDGNAVQWLLSHHVSDTS